MVARTRIRKVDTNEGGSYFAAPKTNIKFIPSGCKTLDLALGGGWAEDRVSNIVGDKSTGKTLLCIEASANFAFKYAKGKIRYREIEAAFDEPYAAALGMPVDRVDFGQSDAPLETVEDLFEDLQNIIDKAKPNQNELVIVDSLDALSDRDEMERDMDKGSYGAEKAKKLSQMFRRLVREMERKHVTLIIVSQIRDKIGMAFGRKHSRSGGKALDFYASQVLYLAHIGRLSQTVGGQKRATGVTVKGHLDKNKVALPFREAEFDIRFGYGIDDGQACLDWLKEVGRLKLSGYTEEERKYFLNRTLLKMSPADAHEEMKRLHEIVTQEWYRIEKTMLPVRSKYAV